MTETIEDPDLRAMVQARLPGDLHGGYVETSLTLNYAPMSVSPALSQVPACPEPKLIGLVEWLVRCVRALGFGRLAKELAFASHGLAWMGVRPFPGYSSMPHLATAEAGAVLAAEILDLYVEVAESVFSGGEAPGPLLPWLEWLTLGGRLPNGAPQATAISLPAESTSPEDEAEA